MARGYPHRHGASGRTTLNGMTKATRISATLPSDLTTFLDEYQQAHHLDSRSAALTEAIRARFTMPGVWAEERVFSAWKIPRS